MKRTKWDGAAVLATVWMGTWLTAQALVLVLAMTGCGLFTPNVEKEAGRTAQSAVNKDQRQPAGTNAKAKDTSTVNIYQGDEAIKAATARQTTAVATTGAFTSWMKADNPWTLFAWAAGLLALVLVIVYIWRKTAALRGKLAVATAPVVTQIKALVAQKLNELDPGRRAALNAEIANLNMIKADIEKKIGA